MCILHIISKQENYGYIIVKQTIKKFQDISESTVYTILRRLCSAGHTEIFYGTVSGGSARKYYRITKKGSEYLAASLHDWKLLCDAVNEIISS